MAKGIKTGGRQRGTSNKVTKDFRLLLNNLLSKEFTYIEQHLNDLESKDRIDFFIKLLPYILPRFQNISSTETSSEDNSSNFSKKIYEALSKNGYGSPSSTDQN